MRAAWKSSARTVQVVAHARSFRRGARRQLPIGFAEPDVIVTEQALSVPARRGMANVRRATLMLVPGVAGFVSTVGIVSGRVGSLGKIDGARFIVFLQVELLAVGVSRLGYEQLVLGRASAIEHPDALGFARPLFSRIVPLAVAVSAVLGLVVGGWSGLGVLIVAPCDVVSSVVASFELARRRFLTTIAFSWLNYPLFLFFLVVPGVRIDSGRLANVVALFCATSVVRVGVALVLIARHRTRHRSEESVPITFRDVAGAGATNIGLNVIQRIDGVVFALLPGRFTAVAVSGYLLSTRLLDATYTVSAVVNGLRQVAEGGRAGIVRWSDRRVLAGSAVWFVIWLLGAVFLALLGWPRVLANWGNLMLAAVGSALYLAVLRLMLREFAGQRGLALGRRFAVYAMLAVACATVAAIVRRPSIMLVPTIVMGVACARALATNPTEAEGRLP
jgi:hypothetical protein